MIPDPPHEQILHRFEVLARHLAYLDRRFDDSNRRLEQAEHRVDTAVGDLGARVEVAIARSTRLHLTAFALAQVGQLLALVALIAVIRLMLWP